MPDTQHDYPNAALHTNDTNDKAALAQSQAHSSHMLVCGIVDGGGAGVPCSWSLRTPMGSPASRPSTVLTAPGSSTFTFAVSYVPT